MARPSAMIGNTVGGVVPGDRLQRGCRRGAGAERPSARRGPGAPLGVARFLQLLWLLKGRTGPWPLSGALRDLKRSVRPYILQPRCPDRCLQVYQLDLVITR